MWWKNIKDRNFTNSSIIDAIYYRIFYYNIVTQ